MSNIPKLKDSLAQQNTPAIPAERGRRMSKTSKTVWFPHSEFQEARHRQTLCSQLTSTQVQGQTLGNSTTREDQGFKVIQGYREFEVCLDDMRVCLRLNTLSKDQRCRSSVTGQRTVLNTVG